MSVYQGRTKDNQSFWITQNATTYFFFIVMLSAAGLYLAGRIPISVFPTPTFLAL